MKCFNVAVNRNKDNNIIWMRNEKNIALAKRKSHAPKSVAESFPSHDSFQGVFMLHIDMYVYEYCMVCLMIIIIYISTCTLQIPCRNMCSSSLSRPIHPIQIYKIMKIIIVNTSLPIHLYTIHKCNPTCLFFS